MSDKDRIIEKIKKCLALANSTNANEAAIALKRAQKLMEAHKIDLAEVGAVEVVVRCPLQVNKKGLPRWFNLLCHLIKEAFAVQVVVSNELRVSDRSYTVTYIGPRHRAEPAGYVHTVLYRAVNRAYKEWVEEFPEYKGARGNRTSFFMGWLWEVEPQLIKMGWEGEEEELAAKLMDIKYPDLRKGSISKCSLNAAMHDGAEAASKFTLNAGVDTNSNKLESK